MITQEQLETYYNEADKKYMTPRRWEVALETVNFVRSSWNLEGRLEVSTKNAKFVRTNVNTFQASFPASWFLDPDREKGKLIILIPSELAKTF